MDNLHAVNFQKAMDPTIVRMPRRKENLKAESVSGITWRLKNFNYK